LLIGDVGLNRATLAPGNSIGVAYLQGRLALTPNSLYEVEYSTASRTSDRFEVVAAGMLDGSMHTERGGVGAEGAKQLHGS